MNARLANLLPRVAIAVLTLLHLVGPYTPINNSDASQIVIGAMIIGAGFVGLFLWSFFRPRRAALFALALFVAVVAISAATDASPLLEGLPVKILLAAMLAVGSVYADSTRQAPDRQLM